MARLIVNADDFGYTAGINRAIVELHGAGVLTSTTLMACGQAFEDALASVPGRVAAGSAGRRRSTPPSGALGVGCHVVLVDGVPSAPVAEIPSLVKVGPGAGRGARPGAVAAEPLHFRGSLGLFVADLLRGRIREGEIESEAVAQIRRLQAAGIAVTHLDTHKHTHIFPGVLRPLLRAALQCGVRAVRNPFEPKWSMEATAGAPLVRRAELRLLANLRPGFLRLVAEAGIVTTDGSLGILATGTLDRATLGALLRATEAQAPRSSDREPTWELVCHPGYRDQALTAAHTRLQAERETEREALLSVAATRKRLRLIHFGELEA